MRVDRRSAGDGARNLRPFMLGGLEDSARVVEKGSARLAAINEVKPLVAHRPDQWVARYRNAASDRDRVVSAKLRRIDLWVIDKGGPISLVVKAPDGPFEALFQVGQTRFRFGLGKIGNRVKAADGQAGM